MHLRRALAAIAALTSAATVAAAQLPSGAISTSGFPIDISAKPAVVRVGGTVTLAGTTASTSTQSKVVLTVTPPTGAPVGLTSRAGSDGAFSATFNNTKTSGQYRVTAVAPDGQGRATAWSSRIRSAPARTISP